jgi:ankyrin repeat protein
MHLAALHNRCEIVEILCNHIKRIEHSGDCSLTRGETIVSPQCSCPTIYPRLNDEDACGDTALHIAIVENHPRIVSTLLRFSKSIADTPMNHHGTMTKVLLEKPQHWHRPLHGAIRDLKLVKALVDGGATVDLPDAEGLTPLMTAIHGKDEEAVGYLLEHGADFHISCSKHKEKTVLQEAVNLCSAAILYRLDTKDPRNDLSTNRGRAILYEAQRRGEWDIVQNLIRHCRARDCIGKVLDGEKTIGFALEFSTVPVVEFLLTNGANPNCQLYYQEDQDLWALPIHVVASAESYSIQAAQCLLQRGASLLSKNGRKKLPCELAMYYSSSPETVGWFLRATIAAIRKQTKTIHIADAMTGFLVESTTRACKQGSVEILQIALKLGKQEIDDFLKMGHLLHIAMRWGRVQVTKYLLEAGCDPTETDLKGRMPTQVPFSAAEGDYNMLSNSQEDYQECLKLVQEAIDLSRTINTTTESTTNQMQLVPTTTHPIPSQHVGLVLTKPPKPSPRQLVSTTTDSPTSRRHRGTVEAPPKPNLRQHSKQTVALTQEFAPRRSRRFLGISMN